MDKEDIIPAQAHSLKLRPDKKLFKPDHVSPGLIGISEGQKTVADDLALIFDQVRHRKRRPLHQEIKSLFVMAPLNGLMHRRGMPELIGQFQKNGTIFRFNFSYLHIQPLPKPVVSV